MASPVSVLPDSSMMSMISVPSALSWTMAGILSSLASLSWPLRLSIWISLSMYLSSLTHSLVMRPLKSSPISLMATTSGSWASALNRLSTSGVYSSAYHGCIPTHPLTMSHFLAEATASMDESRSMPEVNSSLNPSFLAFSIPSSVIPLRWQ